MGVGGQHHVSAALPSRNRRVHGVVPNYAYVLRNFLYPKELNWVRLNLAFSLHGVLPISFCSLLARYNVFLKWISFSIFLDCSSSSSSSSSLSSSSYSCHGVWPIVDPFIPTHAEHSSVNFYVLLTVHLSIILDNNQLDAHLLYFTIRPLQSSTCFEHYLLIIRRLIASI